DKPKGKQAMKKAKEPEFALVASSRGKRKAEEPEATGVTMPNRKRKRPEVAEVTSGTYSKHNVPRSDELKATTEFERVLPVLDQRNEHGGSKSIFWSYLLHGSVSNV
ncbi:hypothetical protein BGZ65_008757, partial [Modicella reniformis]